MFVPLVVVVVAFDVVVDIWDVCQADVDLVVPWKY